VAVVALSSACGGSDPARPAPTLEITPERVLLVGLDDRETLRLRADGAAVPSGDVSWSSSDPGTVAVSPGGVLEARGEGVATVRARLDGDDVAIGVEVFLPSPVDPSAVGTAHRGRQGYVTYVPGRLPVIVSAPHGGSLEPDEIPDRRGGTQVTDLATLATAQAVRSAFLERHGAAPHLVLSLLDRSGLDPNREIVEAAEGNPYAEQAWREYHGFIEAAQSEIEESWGTGLYLDLHGHGHDVQRIELGYLVSASLLNQGTEALNRAGVAESSSLAALQGRRGEAPFAPLLVGERSFGAELAARGYRAIPSPDDPAPAGEPYFTGGYSTARHGSRDGGAVDGIQLELNWSGVRDDAASRQAFAAALVEAVDDFLLRHYGHDIDATLAPRTR
jgi:N-formylglutamate amidohydrolase